MTPKKRNGFFLPFRLRSLSRVPIFFLPQLIPPMKYHLHSSRKNIFREQEKKRKIRVMYQLPVAFLSFVPISLFIFLSLLLPITSFEIVFFFIKKKRKKEIVFKWYRKRSSLLFR